MKKWSNGWTPSLPREDKILVKQDLREAKERMKDHPNAWVHTKPDFYDKIAPTKALIVMMMSGTIEWRGDSLAVSCNDMFAWGCSDSEKFTDDDIIDIYRLWLKDPYMGGVVWVMAKRKELVQEPALSLLSEWDIAQLTSEYELRPNLYDGVMGAIADWKYELYSAWMVSKCETPVPFDAEWWEAWETYENAHPEHSSSDEITIARQWEAANGFT